MNLLIIGLEYEPNEFTRRVMDKLRGTYEVEYRQYSEGYTAGDIMFFDEMSDFGMRGTGVPECQEAKYTWKMDDIITMHAGLPGHGASYTALWPLDKKDKSFDIRKPKPYYIKSRW